MKDVVLPSISETVRKRGQLLSRHLKTSKSVIQLWFHPVSLKRSNSTVNS